MICVRSARDATPNECVSAKTATESMIVDKCACVMRKSDFASAKQQLVCEGPRAALAWKRTTAAL